jgi:hypothetical protein
MWHPVYNARYYVVPIDFSLLIIIFSSSVTTLVYDDTKYSAPFMTYRQVRLYLKIQGSALNLHQCDCKNLKRRKEIIR